MESTVIDAACDANPGQIVVPAHPPKARRKLARKSIRVHQECAEGRRESQRHRHDVSVVDVRLKRHQPGMTLASSRIFAGGRYCSVTRAPNGDSASSIAFVIAAGATSRPPSPTPR